jgi:hypothetical protein
VHNFADGSHTYEPSSAPDGSPLHGQPATRDAAPTVPAEARELHALRLVVESSISTLRSEAKGLQVGTFLRPANAPTAAVLDAVADLLAAAVEP